LNTGLTQVLNDGTNTYTYGLGRISQTNTGIEYFLSDALGSVRQLTNASFTGEQQSNNMVYLRSRYYASGMGRFLTRDTWGGDANSPMSFNRWAYANGNPINLTDPSGRAPISTSPLSLSEIIGNSIGQSDINAMLGLDCAQLSNTVGIDYVALLEGEYGLTILGNEIDTSKAKTFYDAVVQMDNILKREVLTGFNSIFRGSTLVLNKRTKDMIKNNYTYHGATNETTISFNGAPPKENIFHEFGHVFDNIFHDVPTTNLYYTEIYDSTGKFVMGGYYNGKHRQPYIGYLHPCNTTVFACSSEQHPKDMGKGTDDTGDSAIEEWGDLFLN